MRGGYRPGAGRKKGQKDTKPRKGTEAHAEAEKIKAMLAMGIKAKARFYQEFLIRIANKDGKQKPLSLAEKKLMNQLAIELNAEIGEKGEGAPPEDLTPLDYMLRVMNDTGEDAAVRRQMAVAAAPYCHPRKGEGAGSGKKGEQKNRADAAGKGKFAPAKPPLALVK